MRAEEFEEVFTQQSEMCRHLLVDKAKEYADDSDHLHNFNVAAALMGVTREEALGGFLAKHLVSIFDMLKNPGAHSEEKWDEKITDAMNYLFLLQGLLEDRRAKQTGQAIMQSLDELEKS